MTEGQFFALLGDAALAADQAVRPRHGRRVVETSRAWGRLWHLDGEVLRARDPRGYRLVDWLYSITALTPAQKPPMFPATPL